MPEVLEPMIGSNDLLGSPEALRARLDRDSYLLLRGILDADRVRALRKDITDALAELGWIDPDEPDVARAIGFPHREADPGYQEALGVLGKLESFHAFSHQDQVMQVMTQVLGESAFPHPLGIIRMTFPQIPETTTPPHQDYLNNQGTPNLTACWMPLGDVSAELGGLAVLRGSHKRGLMPLRFHLGAGARAAVISPEMEDELTWVSTDYQAGDILIFPALTVHAARVNHSKQFMRLSVDFRYQVEAEELTPHSLEPHLGGLSWDEIYADWRSDELKYYWRYKQYTVVPWDANAHDLPDEMSKNEAYGEVVRFEYKREQEYVTRDR